MGNRSDRQGAKRKKRNSARQRKARDQLQLRKAHEPKFFPVKGPKPDGRRIAKVGRNEDCPCGSGLKFKQCHGVELPERLENLKKHKTKIVDGAKSQVEVEEFVDRFTSEQ